MSAVSLLVIIALAMIAGAVPVAFICGAALRETETERDDARAELVRAHLRNKTLVTVMSSCRGCSLAIEHTPRGDVR